MNVSMNRALGGALMVVLCLSPCLDVLASNPQTGTLTAMIAPEPLRHSTGEIVFVRNEGQWNEHVRFRGTLSGVVVWLCDDEIVYEFLDPQNLPDRSTHAATVVKPMRPIIVNAQFANASVRTSVDGIGLHAQNTNYFLGNDRSGWRTNVSSFTSVMYRDLYEGIDLEISGIDDQLVAQWRDHPGADRSGVKFTFESNAEISPRGDGGISVATPHGVVQFEQPPATASGSTALFHTDKVRRATGPSMSAGIDAVQASSALTLINSTYLGGSGIDIAYGITTDLSGGIYVAGYTLSSDFPTYSAYDSTYEQWFEGFVTKFSPDGMTVEYSTYLGGDNEDWPFGLAIDADDNVYVTGHTNSSNYPLVNAYDATPNGDFDAFVSKLAPTGDSLVYSTYFGGDGADNGWGIVVDTNNTAIITGWTRSTNLPTFNAFDPSYNGESDAFVTAFDASGGALVYSSYLGGSGQEEAHAIGQGAGSVYLTGWTDSPDFQTEAPMDGSYNGGVADVFLTRLASSGDALIYSTYIGGSDIEWSFAIDIDSAGYAYISGPDWSSDLPVTPGAYDTSYNGNEDAFVAKVTPDGDSLVYCSYIGGSNYDFSHAIAVDRAGRACVTGHTESADFPTVIPFDATFNGGQDVFVSLMTPDGSGMTYSTYVGGSDNEHVWIMCDDSLGNFLLAGMTRSADFPTRNAYDNGRDGSSDAFLLKFAPCACPHQGDLDANGVPDAVDLNVLILALFFNGPDPRDEFCPFSRGDFDANGLIDAVDLNEMIQYLYFNGDAPVVASCSP